MLRPVLCQFLVLEIEANHLPQLVYRFRVLEHNNLSQCLHPMQQYCHLNLAGFQSLLAHFYNH